MVKQNTGKWFLHGAWWKRLFLNRRYKDVLFRRLFREKKDLLELYNALNGSAYTDPKELEVVTLEDVIFMKMKNDLSFIVGSSLNLYEHQSSWNPNMPLRGLFYFSRQYEGLISARGDDLYSGKPIEMPAALGVFGIFHRDRGKHKERHEEKRGSGNSHRGLYGKRDPERYPDKGESGGAAYAFDRI